MKTTEQLKREMYAALDKIRRAKKHPSATAVFESAMESFLDALHRQYDGSEAQRMREERDQIQARLHEVDKAYADSQKLNAIAGEELRQTQHMAKDWKEDSDRRCEQLNRQSVETLKWKNKAAEQLIVIKSQREAFGELFVKCKKLESRKVDVLGPDGFCVGSIQF